MFSVLLRAGLTLAAGAVLVWVWAMAMTPFVDVLEQFQTEESDHVTQLSLAVEWMPIIILLSVFVLVFAAAVARRRGPRRL